MNTTKALLFAGLVAAACAAHGTTYYVDNTLDDYTGHDGSSWEKALARIQTAVDKAVNDDVVLVAPGVYGEDQGIVVDYQANGQNVNYSYQPNRIWINGKHITLKSRDGAAMTHIVGRHSPLTETGIGTNAVRCIACSGNASIGGTRIEGFTLRDGGTIAYGAGWSTNRTTGAVVSKCEAAHRGGALLFNYTTGTSGGLRTWQRIHVVDCVISNCVAGEGAASYGVSLVRCRVTQNHTYRSSGGAVVDGNVANCVIDNNGRVSDEFALRQDKQGAMTAVGCTFYNNKGVFSAGSASCLLNCFFEANVTTLGTTCVTTTNCVGDTNLSSENYTYLNDRAHQALLVAPIYGDFRPVANPCYPNMAGKGSRTFCEAQAWMDASDREKDYFGNARWDADGNVTVGAIQDAYDVAGGCLTVTFSRYWIDGRYFDGPNNGYFYTDAELSQHRIKPVPTAGRFVARAWMGGFGNIMRFPDRNGEFLMMPPRASSESMRCLAPEQVATNATGAVWADAAYAGSDSDGSAERPFRTLQDAVDATAAKSVRLVLARPGRYAEGGGFLDGLARVCLTNQVCVYALEGPEKTFIVGANGEGGNEDGCGTNAVRCVSVASPDHCAVVGFTLTDGRTCADDSDCSTEMRMGGGVHATSDIVAQFVDCVITNCRAVRGSAAARGWLINCRVVGNAQANKRDSVAVTKVDRRGVIFRTVASGCLIGPNNYLFAGVDQYCTLWNCTVAETSSTLHISGDAACYNTLSLNVPSTLKRNQDFIGCAIETTATLPIEEGTYIRLTPPAPIADRTKGDFRPLAGSALVSGGVVPSTKPISFVFYTVGGYDKATFPTNTLPVGAFYDPATPVTLVKTRGVAVSGGYCGTLFTSPRYPLVVEATRTDRDFLNFEVNGALVTTNRVLTLEAGAADAYAVKANYRGGLTVFFR